MVGIREMPLVVRLHPSLLRSKSIVRSSQTNMPTFNEIKRKIDDIGGISDTWPEVRQKLDESDILQRIQQLEERFGCQLPTSYIAIQRHYGTFTFAKTVRAMCIESRQGFADEQGQGHIQMGYFYGLEDQPNSVFAFSDSNIPDFPDAFLPIFDGYPGDFVLLSLNKDTFGKIYYFYHEAYEGEELFLVSASLDELIMGLQVVEDEVVDNDEPSDTTQVTLRLTPELLQQLRDSGLNPQNYELM